MTRFEIEHEQFQGPVEKLLELIEEKKLEVTQFSLAEVTADFLEYVRKLEALHGSQQLVADFLVVASRLVLIKSKALLPQMELSEEEQADIHDLETRLRVYQEIKRTQKYVKDLWRETPQMFGREFGMTTEPIFYPPTKMGADMLRDAVARMAGELEKIWKPTATVKREILHLKEKIEEVLTFLTEAPTRFASLRKGKGREELVVLFLAVLHLIKQQFVDVSQDDQFGEITIAKKAIAE